MACFSTVEAYFRSAGGGIVSMHIAMTAFVFLSVMFEDYLEFPKA